MDIKKQNNEQIFQCQVCGFHYQDQELAKRCETWCGEHNSCSLEITRRALENREPPSR